MEFIIDFTGFFGILLMMRRMRYVAARSVVQMHDRTERPHSFGVEMPCNILFGTYEDGCAGQNEGTGV